MIARKFSRQIRRKIEREILKMQPRAQRVFAAHLKLAGNNVKGIRGRFGHYMLDRSVGLSRKESWANARKWMEIGNEVATRTQGDTGLQDERPFTGAVLTGTRSI